MSTTIAAEAPPNTSSPSPLQAIVDAACAHIAPTWPLDRFIAVNPYWGHVQRPIGEAAARLHVLAGSPMLMPRAWYLAQWQGGHIGREHLQAAIDAAGANCNIDQLLAAAEQPAALPDRLPLASDVVDRTRDLRHRMAWRDFITHHLSQCCAAHFDADQAVFGPDRSGGLYPSWRRQSAHDFAPALLMGYQGFAARLGALPAQPLPLIEAALQALRVPAPAQQAYCTALLMSINGWASWCAYRRWQARLVQADDDAIVHLLALRLAWEWLLHQAHPEADIAGTLAGAWRHVEAQVERAAAAQRHDWLWQAALERSHQAALSRGLTAGAALSSATGRTLEAPAAQAVFCIDVRSEVYRRALEAESDDHVHTLGFAGFFALPLSFQPLASAMQRPQLPGLLAPALCATEVCDSAALGQVLAERRRRSLSWRQRWRGFRGGAGSAFSFVESCGLLDAAALLRRSLGGGDALAPEQVGLDAAQRACLRPRLPEAQGEELQAQAALCAGALTGMGLTGDLARLVLLAGHGSSSANNPHAAGLDCGACGGQTGEVNARVLAALLNDSAVRETLRGMGHSLPDGTVFIAALHNTTTDEVQLHDTDLLPDSHQNDLAALRAWLAGAGQRARTERAASLGLQALADDGAALKRTFAARAADWAQVRPEWGLADNAAFIVAPRRRSRHMNLGGRCFLHDYHWQRDSGFKVLELIMTAPMVVANWINLQYHASTVDNRLYGSGNKVLHNVVGGNIGVFEGNGGDLRIGLPLQSLHDGERWRHTPLRLSVFIEAPREAIEAVMRNHALVRQLVDNEWLFLFHIEPDGATIARYDTRHDAGRWCELDALGSEIAVAAPTPG